jgi:hypothetical protein
MVYALRWEWEERMGTWFSLIVLEYYHWPQCNEGYLTSFGFKFSAYASYKVSFAHWESDIGSCCGLEHVISDDRKATHNLFEMMW